MSTPALPAELLAALAKLSKHKLTYVESIIFALQGGVTAKRHPNSDIVTDDVLELFGIRLQGHHGSSTNPLTKEQFERAVERVMKLTGRKVERAKVGNPGHDVTIEGVKFSLKTQADRGIKAGVLWISKFMELGKGQWGSDPKDLIELRDQFLKHIKNYERILSLRAFERVKDGQVCWRYELVEIPKELLLEAKNGKLEMMKESKQTPKPGYCTVEDKSGIRFRLYFDGGGERKLQVKDLRLNLCTLHAEWVFRPED